VIGQEKAETLVLKPVMPINSTAPAASASEALSLFRASHPEHRNELLRHGGGLAYPELAGPILH